MDSLSKTSTLLILTSREDEAEGLIKSLRDGGLAVRGIFTHEPKRLQTLAETNPFDLVLCCEYDPDIDIDAFLSQHAELELDVPLIIVADEATKSSVLISAMRRGARDLTEKGATDHLQLVVARELTDLGHRRNEEHLRGRLAECEKRSRDLVDATGEAVAFIQEGIHVQVNPAYQELYGFDNVDELDGFPLLDLIADDFQHQVGDTLRNVERRGTIVPAELDVQCVRVDGGCFDAHLIISRSKLEGEPCARVMAQAQTPDAPPQSLPQAVDADTDLPNRAALIEELESRMSESGGEGSPFEPFALIYVGVSVFPKLRQDRGLTGGFRAAARFAASLSAQMREGTYTARVADDGYVLLIAGLQQSEAEELTARIRQKVRLPIEQEPQKDDTPQCDTGLIFVDSDKRGPSELLDAAYRDYVLGVLQPSAPKTETKPRETTAGGQDQAAIDAERRLAQDIEHALDSDDGLQLAYQPIVSLKGDSQESYSVLVRLRNNDRTLRAAKDFLTTAAKSGKMVDIDRWVIRKAIAELAAQRSKGQKVKFFVNVGEETLQEDKLLIWICDSLRELQVRGNWLTLQVLEEHARRHAAIFMRLCEGLRKVSCRVSLNRFGSGPDPATLLQSLSLDYVKFPPELGQGLADDKDKQKQLQELTKLCRNAGVKSVVTGVEDARSLTVLWTAGIDYVQGNFLQGASPAIRKPRKP